MRLILGASGARMERLRGDKEEPVIPRLGYHFVSFVHFGLFLRLRMKSALVARPLPVHSHTANSLLHIKHVHHTSNHSHDDDVVVCGRLIRRSYWNSECSCIFSSLPDELLLCDIFTYLCQSTLSTLQSVCTRWKFLSSDRLLWKKLDLSKNNNKISSRSFTTLINRVGNYLNELKLCHLNSLEPSLLSLVSFSTSNLTEIHLCNLRGLSDQLLEPIISANQNLQSISLYGCINITDLSLQHIGKVCSSLKELSVRGCVKLSNESFVYLSSELQGLNIAGCRLIDSVGLDYIANQCGKLERLNAHAISLDDEGINLLTQKCANMNTLHISSANPFGGNPLLTDQSIYYISRLKNLQCLNIQGCSNISDVAMGELFSRCTQLSRLNLGGCYKITNQTVFKIANLASRLTHLSIFQCFNISDEAVLQLLYKSQQLRVLDMHSVIGLSAVVLQQLTQFNNNSLSSLRPSLEESNLTPAINHAARQHYLPNLESLDIGSCRNIHSKDVDQLRSIRPNLNIVHY
jgi:hypothetical protein